MTRRVRDRLSPCGLALVLGRGQSVRGEENRQVSGYVDSYTMQPHYSTNRNYPNWTLEIEA